MRWKSCVKSKSNFEVTKEHHTLPSQANYEVSFVSILKKNDHVITRLECITKTHVRGFFDTDLHEVSWHFATHEAEWVLSSTDRVKISVKEAIQNGFLFLSHT